MGTDALYLRFFFFNDTATTEIYTLSLHDALPISVVRDAGDDRGVPCAQPRRHAVSRQLVSRQRHKPRLEFGTGERPDRKSTRLNSSHSQISYAVFCLKKTKTY